MQKFIAIGRNAKDGELRSTSSGINVYTNTIAIQNDYKNKDGGYDSEFIDYVAYRNSADFLHKYSGKGTLIYIEGILKKSSYEDKDKIKRYSYKITIEKANILEKKKDTQETQVEVPEVKSNYEDGDIVLTEADLPF